MRQRTLTACLPGATAHRIPIDGVTLAVETLGQGPAVLLLHGFPHTRAIWRAVAPRLAEAGLRVIAPDLHGLGDSTASVRGYEAVTLARDLLHLVDCFGDGTAHVAGVDLGVAPAFALAAEFPERVATLTLSEGLIGALPGAEAFPPPWWFGFHQAPGGLAEDVLAGAEDRYVRFFLSAGSRQGVPSDLTRLFVEAYRDTLHNAFDHYRAMPPTAAWIASWAASHRLTMPVLAVGAGAVGDATAAQLAPIATRLTSHLLEDCGHLTPIDQPDALAGLILEHASRRDDPQL